LKPNGGVGGFSANLLDLVENLGIATFLWQQLDTTKPI
jgi:hypothetical protein